MSIGQAGLFHGVDHEGFYLGNKGWGPLYTNWDANISSTCVCDIGK